MGPITPEQLSEWLDAEIVGVEATRIGDGLVGMNLRLVPRYATGSSGPASVVVKLPSEDPTSRATGIALRNYEREVRFYTELAHTVDIRVAHCYHGEWGPDSGEFVLVLEDLAPARQGDQLTGCGPDHARAALAELAGLHAPRWGDPSLEELEWLSRRRSADEVDQLAGIYRLLLPGFLATYARYLDTDGVALVERFADRLADWLSDREGPSTVTHGDYRLDNLMFAPSDAGPRVAAVDWQTPGHGPGCSDLSYFLGAGLTTEDRRAHERDLVAGYVAELARRGVDVDEGWVWHQYARDAFAGIVMSVVASQIVQVTERSEAMFAAMATRHVRHALDLDAESLV
jgi:hypothetical protein